MNRIMVLAATLVLIFAAGAKGDDPTVAEVTHQQLQAVNEDGVGTYTATDKVTITGIVLNNPEEMLDPTSSESGMGGQYQFLSREKAAITQEQRFIWHKDTI